MLRRSALVCLTAFVLTTGLLAGGRFPCAEGAEASSALRAKPPVYIWFEPEWFEGVKGSFGYWSGMPKATGSWGIAGPGISAEWTQGGESEWNSMGAAAEETQAKCHRDFTVPRAGKYAVWVRYYDHRNKTEPFRVSVTQAGRPTVSGELGVHPVVPKNDEYQLYWNFAFGWGMFTGDLQAGPARITLETHKPGEAFRQVDAVLLTDDMHHVPLIREKPRFNYLSTFTLAPPASAHLRGRGEGFGAGTSMPRIKLANRDFSMWSGIDNDPKWWNAQKVDALKLTDLLFQFGPHTDIRSKFHEQFAGQRNLPIISSPLMLPGLYLGGVPDLSTKSPLRKWFEQTKTPFYIMTNYAAPTYPQPAGKETFEALNGPLAHQFLGYIHGENVATQGVGTPPHVASQSRRERIDSLAAYWPKKQAEVWKGIYGTPVPESHWNKGIACLSVDSIAYAHLYHETGAQLTGYEEDATNVHIPMRIAFERGAARQYGGGWINYASGNFGDACNYFWQNPVVPRGAPSWYHSKYTITDGVSISWYRKLYYMNYFGGASAIYWEQNLGNQWILPGPGNHPIMLSPYGRATEDFQACVARLPDRGEPLAPVGILLNYGHGYERVNNYCLMLDQFRENAADRELRELFNVLWYPTAVSESQVAAPDVQSMPSGRYGNIFDVLVDRPSRAKAILDYPVIWAAGDVKFDGAWPSVLNEYLQRGGTLVLNLEACRQLPASLTGLKLGTGVASAEDWTAADLPLQSATPFDLAHAELQGAKPVVWTSKKQPVITRHEVQGGAVIVCLVPQLSGQDERAHPALPYLMNGLTAGLLPVEVRLSNGERPQGEVAFQINKTKEGYVVLLTNNRGIDKTQNGVARVDRSQAARVVLHTRLFLRAVKEYTEPREISFTLSNQESTISLTVPAGDVQVIGLITR